MVKIKWRLLLIGILAICLIGCNNIYDYEDSNETVMLNESEQPTLKTLYTYANEYVNDMFCNTVQILVETNSEKGSGSCVGTGVIYDISDNEVKIISCYHIINYEVSYVSSLTVIFNDGVQSKAYVIGYDIENDIILLSVKKENLSVTTLESISITEFSQNTLLAQNIYVVGNSMGNGISITKGIISAVDRTIPDYKYEDKVFIQIDAAVNEGNSGGGIFDETGKCIGLVCTKKVQEDVDNVAYAIPTSRINSCINSIKINSCTGKKIKNPYNILISGVNADNVELLQFDLETGFMVAEIKNEEFSMINKFDIIYKIDDMKITSIQSIYNEFVNHTSGDTVRVYYYKYDSGKYKKAECSIKLK